LDLERTAVIAPIGDIASASDDDALAKCQQIAALADELCPEAVQQLIAYLGDDHPFVRWEAGIALGNVAARLQKSGLSGLSGWAKRSSSISWSDLLAGMQKSLQADAPDRRSATADALGLWHHKAVTSLLLQALNDDELSVRVSAATALSKIKGDESVQALVAALADPSVWVRRAAADALGAIADPRAVPALRQALSDPQTLVRTSAVSALGHTNSGRARAALIESTRSDEPATRWYAARGLASIGTVSALPALRELLRDETILFGESIAEMADSAIVAIEERQEGFLNGLSKMFHELRYRLQKNP
jgi:HEAT repeat protein